MASHSISPSVKMGGPKKHFARGICEMRDQNKRLFRGKTVGRELLITFAIARRPQLLVLVRLTPNVEVIEEGIPPPLHSRP